MDGGIEAVDGISPGTFSALNINSGYLFVGGIPVMMASTNTLPQVITLH